MDMNLNGFQNFKICRCLGRVQFFENVKIDGMVRGFSVEANQWVFRWGDAAGGTEWESHMLPSSSCRLDWPMYLESQLKHL